MAGGERKERGRKRARRDEKDGRAKGRGETKRMDGAKGRGESAFAVEKKAKESSR